MPQLLKSDNFYGNHREIQADLSYNISMEKLFSLAFYRQRADGVTGVLPDVVKAITSGSRL